MRLHDWLCREIDGTRTILGCIPPLTTTLFVLSVTAMNLLANKELFNTRYLALDCGFTISWIAFLLMDMICKRFGARAAMRISIMALLVNLLISGLFWVLCQTPGHWGAYYTIAQEHPETAQAVNEALSRTIGGTWYVVLGSALAMLVSSFVNAVIHHAIARRLRGESYRNFATSSLVSTLVAQLADNLIFSTVVSHVFFNWTWTQVLVCSLTGAAVELIGEVVFIPLGYRAVLKWKAGHEGADDRDHMPSR